MRTFHIFNVNSSILVLTKDDAYPLFHSFLKIKNLDESDLSIAVNLYEQIASPIDKEKYAKKIYNHYKECDFYSKYRFDHSYINKYKDEKSYLYVKNSYMRLDSNMEYPEFFKFLKKNHNLFACDFENKDYFWLKDI